MITEFGRNCTAMERGISWSPKRPALFFRFLFDVPFLWRHFHFATLQFDPVALTFGRFERHSQVEG
jgi:hypothetical protein